MFKSLSQVDVAGTDPDLCEMQLVYEVVGFNHIVRLVLRPLWVVMLGYSKTYKCGLVSGPKREISEASKLVDQRTLCTVSSSIPSGLVASCWPVLPSVWSVSNLVES